MVGTRSVLSGVFAVVPFRLRCELAFTVHGHQPKMIRTERVQHVKDALRGGKSQRFGGTALFVDGVARQLSVHPK